MDQILQLVPSKDRDLFCSNKENVNLLKWNIYVSIIH